MPFDFEPTEIPEVIVVHVRAFEDPRGVFMEVYKRSAFEDGGIDLSFVQDNFSRSHRHVLRGLHYQNPPHPQGKLVRVSRGEILDIAVDIRRNSPTYAKAVTRTLSDDNRRLLWVPPGFAHGFLVLSGEADVVYKVTAEFAAEHDRGIRWNDPAIGLEIPVEEPLLSEKDSKLPTLDAAENGFVFEHFQR